MLSSALAQHVAVLQLLGKILAQQTAQAAELAALRKIAETERTVSTFVSPLALDDDVMTIGEAAKFALRDRQTLRNWCRSDGIGIFDPGRGRWLVSHAKLSSYLHLRFGIKS